MSARFACACALLLAAPALARAQSFAPPVPAGPQPGAAALLDRALASEAGGLTLEAGAARWFGLEQLGARSLALGARVRSCVAAAGVAQAGDPEYGWSAAALALGSAGASGALALRVEARHERRDGALASARAADAALEAGAGGWLALGGAWRAWAAAPQLAGRGGLLLARPLELGVRAESEDGALWAAVEAPSAGLEGARVLGGALAAGPFTLWAEARDGPWRAALGLAASRGALRVAARVDAHPALPASTRLALAWTRPGSGR